MTSYTGPTQVSVFAMIALKHAIRLYGKTGMKVNRAYTPTIMKKAAETHTGKTFKRGEWLKMEKALDDKINEVRATEEFAEGK